MSGNTMWRAILTVLSIGLAVFFVVDKPAQLGLDLEGGTQVVLDLKPRNGQQLSSDAANRTLEVLRKRVDSLGVTEPNLEVAGDKRIIVELPGVSDPTEAVKVIGSTAQLTFHPVLAQVAQQPTTTTPVTPTPDTTPSTTAPSSPSTTAAGLGQAPSKNSATILGQTSETTSTTPPVAATTPPTTANPEAAAAPDQTGAIVAADDTGATLSLGPSAIDGSGVSDASAVINPQNGLWEININFKGSGGSAWTKLTGEAACNQPGDVKRQVAIVLDNKIISHPQVDPSIDCNVGITGGSTVITGSTSSPYSAADAKSLALLIRGGALPVDVSIASQTVIGPELGKQAISDSKRAVVIGGILTILYIISYYRLLGLIAGIALAAYSLIAYATLLALNLTLTLPGIAAFVLAIGMAMDSNVLVYERVKEELAAGKSMKSAARLGFKNALSAIVDSNFTTFLAAGTLFFLAVGEVKGFGVSLLVGTSVSIFVTLVVLRTLVQSLLSTNWARNHPRALGMYVGRKFRTRMAENPPPLMKISRYFMAFSALMVVLSVAGWVGKGINFGIEFTGGRLLEYSTATPVDVDQARVKMADIGFPRAVVQRSGADDVSVRVPELNAEQLASVQAALSEIGGGSVEKLRDETIGPSFGKELKQKAMIGLFIGVGIQLIFVAIRYRWTFGVGAVLGMVHDALIVLGLFIWLGKPFDAVFLASLLTIIAFSVNDSVVVFDRIREQRRRRGGIPFLQVVSDACAQTFPRTLNISMSAIFILGALFFLGGQTLRDFALAVLLGVVAGVYSSVFIAAPITVLLERWKPATGVRGSTSNTRRSPGNATTTKNKRANVDDEDGEGEGQTTVKASTAPRPAPRPRKKSKKRR